MAIQQGFELYAIPVLDNVIKARCLKRALYVCPRCNCVFFYAAHFTAHFASHFKAAAPRARKRLRLGLSGDSEIMKKDSANPEGAAMEDSADAGANA